MTKTTFSSGPNFSSFSAFGGTPLGSTLAQGGTGGFEIIEGLHRLGITDVEQLVALRAVNGAFDSLMGELKVSDKQLSSFVDEVASQIPERALSRLLSPGRSNLGLGVLPPTSQILDRAEASSQLATAAASAPASVSLINDMPFPPYQQGTRGTCVAQALTALNEYCRGVPAVRLSAEHLYYQIKQIDGYPANCGTLQAKAAGVLSTRGQCTEISWPYNPNPPCNSAGPVPSAAEPEAKGYVLELEEVPARDLGSYKLALADRQPVPVSIPVYRTWYESAEVRLTGRITMRIGGEAPIGGHAICLVGYQDDGSAPGGGYFLLRNSWGTTTWASESPYSPGYGAIPYAYIANEAWEAFTAKTLALRPDSDTRPDSAGQTAQVRVTIDVEGQGEVTVARQPKRKD